jgi:hypothetical protein
VYYFDLDSPEAFAERNKHVRVSYNAPRACQWSEGDPLLFNLRTKLGVTYDGGHWFHMAENFMTQHSIIRANQASVSDPVAKRDAADTTNEVYMNFDNSDFIDDLNGVTELFVLLGMTQHTAGALPAPAEAAAGAGDRSTPGLVHFTSIPHIRDESLLHDHKTGDHILIYPKQAVAVKVRFS